ncbi:MAG: SIMPL domain-containing protein [Anaerolineaceae bacterium]|nr:SIMPL domain-containing protein [Anaerolineaceae bacterium]
MFKKLLPVLITAILALAITACSAGGGSLPGKSELAVRTLNVAGTGKVTLAPDVAYVYIGVQSQSENVSDALNQNNGKAQAISSTLVELGVDIKDIQTSSFNIYPQQQYSPEGQITGTIYVVDNTVNVTVRDLSKLGELLDAVVRSGANNIHGISFDVLDKSAAITEARKLAIADAQMQAGELAAAAGVTLGELQSLNAYTNTNAIPYYSAKGGYDTAAASTVPVSAGQMMISVDVNMSYEIK